MATLDLRHAGKLLIQVLAGKPWNFEMTANINVPSLTGASATMIITRNGVIQSLAIGTGLTITAANKIAIAPAPLALGNYDYSLEITPLTGEVIRIIDKIHSTNE